VFTCANAGTQVVGYDVTSPDNYISRKFSVSAGKVIDSFFISDHPIDPVLNIVTKPATGSGPVVVESRLLNGDDSDNVKYTVRDVSNGAVFSYGDEDAGHQIRMTKLDSYMNTYYVADACPTGSSDFDNSTSIFCYNDCAKKRVVFGDERCPAKCPSLPSAWVEQNYLGTTTPSSKVKVCVPPFTIDATEAYWPSLDQVFEFNSKLSALGF